MRGGRNVEFHYYDRPFFSELWKCLFSSLLLQHQNVEIEIDKDQNIEIDKDHYYENQNVEKNEKNIKSLSFVLFSNSDKVILPMA